MSDDIAFARPFILQRDRDISDVSGTGIIADGVLFPDGHAALHWRGKWPLTTPHPDGMDSIIAIHDHGGRGELHVIWPEEEKTRRIKFLTDVAAAFDVPTAVLGTEAARTNLSQQITAVLRAAAFREQARYRPTEEAVRVPEAIEVTGHLDRFAEAVMPVVDQLLAVRDRAQKVAGRAYLLADRWEAAHGSASFLVRAAGVELREALDSARDDPAGTDAAATQTTDDTCTTARQGVAGIRGLLEHAGIDTSRRDIRVAGHVVDAAVGADNTAWCGSRARHDAHNWVDYASPRRCPGYDSTSQEEPKRNVAAAVEVRDPCPYCEGCPLIPRTLMDDHVRAHHPEVRTVEPGAPVPPADDEVERARDLLLARFGADQASVVDRLISAVEMRSYCALPHEMEV